VATRGGLIGPGHFGHIALEKGVEKMSLHYEADLAQGGRSVLGILPVVWKDGWPVAGEKLKEGSYEIESVRRGYALELAVDFPRMAGGMRGFGQPNSDPIKPVPPLALQDVIKTWPEGNGAVRIGDYMSRPHQQWSITDAPDTTGYLGGPYYKIVLTGTDRALTATAAGEVITTPSFTGAPEQLWRIDQLTDGSYRIMPKLVPGSGKKLALVSSGDSSPTLAEFDFSSDNSKWNLRVH
jgi:arabinan endo-1,5-alpha-L-arabinosidase